MARATTNWAGPVCLTGRNRGGGWLAIAAMTAGLLAASCRNHASSVEGRTDDVVAGMSSAANACCAKLFHHGAEFGRCVADAAHGRGPCGGRDAGHDALVDAAPTQPDAADAHAADDAAGVDAAPADAAPPFGQCPVIVSASATRTLAGVTLTAAVSDPDGDPVSVTWFPLTINLSPSTPQPGTSAEVNCVGAGSASVQLFVDDGRGAAAIVTDCPQSFSVINFSCDPLPPACAGNPCDDSSTCCAGTVCSAGLCQVCVPGLGAACDVTHPCCQGTQCIDGACLLPSPSCMADGHVCDATHPCCSGAACTNSICGNVCVGSGASCDSSHPCCTGDACVNGTCQVSTCVPETEPCAFRTPCCVGFCQPSGFCDVPGCASHAFCTPGTACCSGNVCSAGRCTRILGCLLRDFPCLSSGDCCSGVCGRLSSTCL